MASFYSGSLIPAQESPPKTYRTSSTGFGRPEKPEDRARAWVYQSSKESSKPTAGVSGLKANLAQVALSSSPCLSALRRARHLERLINTSTRLVSNDRATEQWLTSVYNHNLHR